MWGKAASGLRLTSTKPRCVQVRDLIFADMGFPKVANLVCFVSIRWEKAFLVYL